MEGMSRDGAQDTHGMERGRDIAEREADGRMGKDERMTFRGGSQDKIK